MNRYLTLVVIAFSVAALTGCVAATPPTVTPLPSQTAVPISEWLAEGIPADTLITYSFSNDFLPYCHWREEIGITATGSAIYEGCAPDGRAVARFEGQLSPETLKQVILAFAENDFFSLAVDEDGCVYDIADPAAALASKAWAEDAGRTSVAITIGGRSWHLYYPNGCSYLDDKPTVGEQKRDAIVAAIHKAVKDLPPAAPTVMSTPTDARLPTAAPAP